MSAFYEQEQNKYTTMVREYSVYGTAARPKTAIRMSVMMLSYCCDLAKTATFELHKSSVQHSTVHCHPIFLH